jgi:hypothetical protein
MIVYSKEVKNFGVERCALQIYCSGKLPTPKKLECTLFHSKLECMKEKIGSAFSLTLGSKLMIGKDERMKETENNSRRRRYGRKRIWRLEAPVTTCVSLGLLCDNRTQEWGTTSFISGEIRE